MLTIVVIMAVSMIVRVPVVMVVSVPVILTVIVPVSVPVIMPVIMIDAVDIPNALKAGQDQSIDHRAGRRQDADDAVRRLRV